MFDVVVGVVLFIGHLGWLDGVMWGEDAVSDLFHPLKTVKLNRSND